MLFFSTASLPPSCMIKFDVEFCNVEESRTNMEVNVSSAFVE